MLSYALAEWAPNVVRLIKDRDGGGYRSHALVEFAMLETADRVMDSFGPNGTRKLLVDGVTLNVSYSSSSSSSTRGRRSERGGWDRDRDRDRDWERERERERERDRPRGQYRSDWLCPQCSCQNFARRNVCMRCNEPRTSDAVALPDSAKPMHPGAKATIPRLSRQTLADPWETGLAMVVCDAPTNVLFATNLSQHTTEEKVAAKFAEYAPLVAVRLLRDKITGASRGVGFVEFALANHASHVLQSASGMELDGMHVRLSYACLPANVPVGDSGSSSYTAAQLVDALALLTGDMKALNESSSRSGPLPAIYAAAIETAQQRAAAAEAEAEAAELASAAAAARKRAAEGESQWPPTFEEAGASYVFDSGSGYFFEARSNTYYDPKSKLYHKNNQWLKHLPGQNPPYAPAHMASPNAGAGGAVGFHTGPPNQSAYGTPGMREMPVPIVETPAAHAPTPSQQPVTLTQKPISFSFGGGGSKKKAAVPVVLKKHKQDISIWSTKQKELAVPDNMAADPAVSAAPGDEAAALGAQSASQQQPKQPGKKAKTAKPKLKGQLLGHKKPQPAFRATHKVGEAAARAKPPTALEIASMGAAPSANPHLLKVQEQQDAAPVAKPVTVCLLCQRAFQSPEQLAKHEAKSSLHAQNLAKAKKEGSLYRDRAAERREKYGPTDPEEFVAPGRGDGGGRGRGRGRGRGGRGGWQEDRRQQQLAPRSQRIEHIEDSNVGNQMLRQMGWESGKGLGKDGQGITAPVKADGAVGKEGVGARSSLGLSAVDMVGDYQEVAKRVASGRFNQLSR
ncbi:unnamed protein product [Chrysoparadoxa australica]